MLNEDNTFDFLRQINGLESAVNAFYHYFRSKNIQVDESNIQVDESNIEVDESYIQYDESYINFFDKIINSNELDEYWNNELLLNTNKEIIPNFVEDVDNNIETEFKIEKKKTYKKTKNKYLQSNINNINSNCKAIKKKYSCKKCGKLYIDSDGVRKHWKNKHNKFELKRGNIDSYTTIIFQTEETYEIDKINLLSYNYELMCYESIENIR